MLLILLGSSQQASPKYCSISGSGDNTSSMHDNNSKDLFYLRLAMTSIYVGTFLISIFGNTIVIFVLIKDKKIRKFNNVYNFSLSLADTMIILFCLRIAVYELHYGDEWILGGTICQLVPFLQYLSVNAEILTIAAIGIERFIIICQPLKARALCTKRRSFRIVSGLWLLATLSSLPTFIYTDLVFWKDDEEDCAHCNSTSTPPLLYCIHVSGGEWLSMSQVIIFYVFPGLFLFAVYVKISKHLNKSACRDIRMYSYSSQPNVVARRTMSRRTVHVKSTVILMAYFLFLLPYNAIVTMAIFVPNVFGLLNERSLILLFTFVRALYFANASLNPILYTAISENFRKACSRTFVNLRHITKRQRNESSSLLYFNHGVLLMATFVSTVVGESRPFR